ncbi:site-specific integrase [Sporosarcina sp. FSL K6-1508]|uniref:site-specific integrase n=1 Tax=Sporosarcina sp. FSL K6-1508 TaxID=2921553 RepID=UPI0030F9BA23
MAKGHARERSRNIWQLEVDLGSYKDPETGRRKRNRKYKTVTAKGQREADTELAKFVTEVTGDDYFEPTKMMFFDFVMKEWLPKCGELRLSHTTLATHIEYLELRILPAFKYLRVDQIQPKHIVDFIYNISEDGMRADGKEGKLASSTIFYHYRILNNIFNFAVEIKMIEESPLENVQKPSVEYEESEVYDLEETVLLLACLQKELLHWQVAVILAVTKGMRRSELFGLDLLKHFNFRKNTVEVRQALTYSKRSGFQIHEIKKGNKRAKKRNIALSAILHEPLSELITLRMKERAVAEELWEDGKHCLLLAHEDGEPYNPSSMRNWWVRFLKRHNLRYIKLHSLRHTMVTLLIELEIPLSAISDRAGHSGIQITNDTYGHKLKTADQVATAKLDAALSGTNKNQ